MELKGLPLSLFHHCHHQQRYKIYLTKRYIFALGTNQVKIYTRFYKLLSVIIKIKSNYLLLSISQNRYFVHLKAIITHRISRSLSLIVSVTTHIKFQLRAQRVTKLSIITSNRCTHTHTHTTKPAHTGSIIIIIIIIHIVTIHQAQHSCASPQSACELLLRCVSPFPLLRVFLFSVKRSVNFVNVVLLLLFMSGELWSSSYITYHAHRSSHSCSQ